MSRCNSRIVMAFLLFLPPILYVFSSSSIKWRKILHSMSHYKDISELLLHDAALGEGDEREE